MDSDAAYLDVILRHTIYARAPPGVVTDGATVLRLQQALYGRKQSGREWYALLSQWLRDQSFTQASLDPCVFMSDDLMSGTLAAISATFKATGARSKVHDLGSPRLLLALEVE